MTFAQIDENNKVIFVTPIVDVADEQTGINFCKSIFGQNTNWVQTSYSGSFRNKFAGIGDEWHTELNAFIKKPFASWILNADTKLYEAPKP